MYTVVSALVAAEKAFLGENRVWKFDNQKQAEFIGQFLEVCRPDLGKIKEFETIASLSEEPINAFLRDKGFDIQLDKFPVLTPPERAWGAASVLDLLLKWREKGEKTEITTPDKRNFPAAKMPSSGTSVFGLAAHPYPIAQVRTDSDDTVFMTVCDEELEIFDLVHKAEWILDPNLCINTKPSREYEGLVFPMIDLDHKVDINWLTGMFTIDDEGWLNRITQALQQTKLKMNHEGARIKDAVAVAGVREYCFTPRQPLIIDKPFLFLVKRPGLDKPLFAARLTEEVWKDPGSLDM